MSTACPTWFASCVPELFSSKTMLFLQEASGFERAEMPAHQLAILFGFCILASAPVVAVVAATIYKLHKNRLDDALKRELLDRGMTAEEIVAVVNAKPTKSPAGKGVEVYGHG